MKDIKRLIQGISLIVIITLVMAACAANDNSTGSTRLSLTANWKMISSEKTGDSTPEQISVNGFNDGNWYKAVVPGTVMGSLVTNRVVEDPYFGINMQKIDTKQFIKPWWYRTTFDLSREQINDKVWLRFQGINYRADLWVNGNKVVGSDSLAGAYRMFRFNIDKYKKEGQNTLALLVTQPADGEYSTGFCDWNPLPIDRNLGIFREVILETDKGVTIQSPFVYSKVDTVSKDAADLYIAAQVSNTTDKTVSGVLRINYELGTVEQNVSLSAGSTVDCLFEPKDFAQLSVKNVSLWWPNGMGKPSMYNIKAEFIAGGKVLDEVDKKYGIRQIKSYLNKERNRTFSINGNFVLIKGGGWTDDVLLQDTKSSVEAQLRYVRHMNMNSIRCEGFWGKDETLYSLCDEYGILVMVGWSCHWEWEEYLLKPCHEKYGGAVSREDIDLLAALWKDQMMWLRNHPSIYVWMLGSDKLPTPELEKRYIELFSKYDPSRPYITSAGGVGTETNNIVAQVPLYSELSGPTGMKMLGPYAWTPPHYWFTDTKLGGGWGFNTETCPGASIPPLASLKKMLPAESLWPVDKKYWEYHTGRNEFTSLDRDLTALSNRYGAYNSVEELAARAQVMNYEVMRPMFEAFVADKPVSTGLIQWKLNSAWPDMIWQLYDTYLQPNGAFYAVRKACNPLHAIYRYGFNDIYLSNEDLADAGNLTVSVKAYDINSKEIFSDKWQGEIKSNTSKQIYKIPEIKGLTPVWFLKLSVTRQDGSEADNSVYWLSLKNDVLDFKAASKLSWPYYTPTSSYADFTALNKLAPVNPDCSYTFSTDGQFGKVSLKIKNNTGTIAFFLYLDVLDPATGQPVLPIYWNDNYITLFPGEERSYEALYYLDNLKDSKPTVEVSGWNVKKVTLKAENL